jgi:glucan biosynthesis protein C
MPAILLAGDFFDGGVAEDRFTGGWHWQAAAASLTEGVLASCVSLWAIGYFRHHHNHLRPLARRMAPAAYGAFIVHPPVIVGLALAVQPLALPAELKFVCVLSGGVVASFGLAALAARVRPITRIIGSRPPTAREVPSAIRR